MNTQDLIAPLGSDRHARRKLMTERRNLKRFMRKTARREGMTFTAYEVDSDRFLREVFSRLSQDEKIDIARSVLAPADADLLIGLMTGRRP